MYTYKPEDCRVPIKVWSEEGSIEQGALDQIEAIASLPFVYKQVSLMPDTHQGYGMPIGGVAALKGVVVPNFVGFDIGCGVCFSSSDVVTEGVSQEDIKRIMQKIRDTVPVGTVRQSFDQEWEGFSRAPDIEVVQSNLISARKQLGTLGSGNHFLELQKDEGGFLCIMIHSGSRNFGYKVAEEYQGIAVDLCSKWHSDIPNKDLAFLPLGTHYAKDYLDAMNYTLEFAKANRSLMMKNIQEAISSVIACDFSNEVLDVHHNYASIENHFGSNVMVHRKGATSARDGQLGIVPGSMGTSSYIVIGKGNKDSFNSCSHGAGRTMSRTQAKKTLSLEAEIATLDAIGVIHGMRSVSNLDEAPSAYKDIAIVMESQKDLVSIVNKLTPIAVIKG